MSVTNKGEASYILGHSEAENLRLGTQAICSGSHSGQPGRRPFDGVPNLVSAQERDALSLVCLCGW
jgi:hypothetical protein